MRVFVAFVAVCATAAALSDVSVFSATLNRVVKAEAVSRGVPDCTWGGGCRPVAWPRC